MFLARANNESDACPPGHVSCSPSSDDPGPSTTTFVDGPGPHRFIGIGMVAALAIVVLILWLYFAKFPRRKFLALNQCCCMRSTKADDDDDDATQTTIAVSDFGSSTDKLKELNSVGSSGSEDDAAAGRRGDSDAVRNARRSRRISRHRSTEKAAAREKRARALEETRNQMLQAEPRGMIKQVSGGVVMYTEVPRAAVLPRRDRYPMDWEFEHVHGVRFEVRMFPFINLLAAAASFPCTISSPFVFIPASASLPFIHLILRSFIRLSRVAAFASQAVHPKADGENFLFHPSVYNLIFRVIVDIPADDTHVTLG